jgi:phosphatidylglycerol:prolipoprotein diacylglycerol transferase
MYPALPLGPITLPTAPIFALLAVYLGLETAGRVGRRLGLRPDDLWNTGLIALLAGFIVARVWNVFQFWYVYSAEPLLLFSLRPSGFAFWPGVAAAVAAAYGYLLRYALHPTRVVAAFAAGALMAASALAVSDYLTGAIVGLPSDLPWARPYFGEMRHPAALYRAVGFGVSGVWVWLGVRAATPGRTVGHALLAASLVILLADAYVADSAVVAGLRSSQLGGLGGALAASGWLALLSRRRAPSV